MSEGELKRELKEVTEAKAPQGNEPPTPDRKRVQSDARQGEFITRIICQTTFRNTFHGKEEIFNLEAIKQLINEAKKDSPYFEEWESIRDLTTLERSFFKWFDKWLGDR